MKKQHLSLIGISWLLLMWSCTNHYKNLEVTDYPSVAKTELTSVFYKLEKAQVFDTGIRFRKYYASGLLVIKAEEGELYRIVMTSKLGSKIFDFSLGKELFTVHFCIEPLNKKLVLNLLKKDLRLLTNSYLEPEKMVALADTTNNHTIYRVKAAKAYRHFTYDNASAHLTKIERGSKRKARTVVDIGRYKNNAPNRIELKHLQFKLEMTLKRLKTSPG